VLFFCVILSRQLRPLRQASQRVLRALELEVSPERLGTLSFSSRLPFDFQLPALFTLSVEGSAAEGSTVNCLSLSPVSATRSIRLRMRLLSDQRESKDSSPLSPFPATLTHNSQVAENTATLSPLPATLTGNVNHKSFVCHSYAKHPGWGVPLSAQTSHQVTSHESPVNHTPPWCMLGANRCGGRRPLCLLK
jgi:hypothetical protein